MARSKTPFQQQGPQQPGPQQPRTKEPRHLPDTAAAKAAREARLAEEMRKNLQKRKARQRALRDHGGPD